MTLDAAKNFAKAALSTGYTSGATSVVLVSGGGAKFPAVPFNAVWWNSSVYADPSDDPNVEVVRVTNISTDTLTITRAQESTSAANHNTAGMTYTLVAGPTAKLRDDIPLVAVLTVSGNLSLTAAHTFVRVDASGAARTMTLPSVAAIGAGKVYYVKKIDGSVNGVTIARSGSDTIDGAASFTLATQYQEIGLVSPDTGTDWSLF